MKKKSSVLFKISVILFVTALVCLIASMIFQAVFDSQGVFAAVEVACAGTSGFLAFIGIILSCIRNNKTNKKEVPNYEDSQESQK